MENINYKKAKNDASILCSSNKRIYSPVFKKEIFLTSEGFNHIIFKNNRTERDKKSQLLRFNLIARAIKLLKSSTTYQEFEEILESIEVKKHKRKIKENKIIRYWGIIAIIENRKIKVIIRKIRENGNIHFWSIIPSWTTNTYRDKKYISTMKGSPKED